MNRFSRAMLTATALTLVAAPSMAQAQDTTTTTVRRRPEPSADRVNEVKRRCLAQIDRRVTALDTRQRELVNARHLSAEHKAALDADINRTRAGLKALAEQIRAETDPVELRRECESIWTAYRVFVLVLPRTRLVATADAELFAVRRLTDVAARLEDAIDKAEADGKDVTEPRADLEAMKAKIASASTAAAGVAPSILPLTPADWNANHDVLVPAKNAVRSARSDLQAAAGLGREIVAALKA